MVALATYMGHVNIYATYWYLEATADLMRDVAAAGEAFMSEGRAIMTPIAPLIEAFLRETLARQRGVSRHTRDSYALSFQLLFDVRCREAQGLAIGADAGADRRQAWSAPSSSIWRICARTRR